MKLYNYAIFSELTCCKPRLTTASRSRLHPQFQFQEEIPLSVCHYSFQIVHGHVW